MTAYTIARPINGISLNGDEYICDYGTGKYVVFESEIEAEIAMLKRFAAEVIDEQGIYVKQIDLEDEP
jgi:hypothetical protein